MDAYDVIDCHTHVQMSAEHTRDFLRHINRTDGPRDGTAQDCLRLMDRVGIKTTQVLPALATRQIYDERLAAAKASGKPDPEAVLHRVAEDCSTYNRWAAQLGKAHPGRFAGLVALDPVLFGREWARKEIESRLADGAVGLKIVPTFIGAAPNDPRMAVVWEEAHKRGLPVISQSGVAARPTPVGHPSHFEDVLKAYPNCKVVLAHMGRGAEDTVARLAARYANLYCDTSVWLGDLGKPGHPSVTEGVDIIRRIGVDRVLFGTNYPMYDPLEHVDMLRRMPVTEDERRRISAGNYRRVFRTSSIPSLKST